MKSTSVPIPEEFLSITQSELEAVDGMQSMLDSIQRQLESTRYDEEKSDVIRKRAQSDYIQAPTTKNFESYKALLVEKEQQLVLVRAGHLRSVAKRALDLFIREKILPVATVIIVRNLQSARRNLSEVKEQENERHEEMFGVPIEKSTLIDAFSRPVEELDELNAALITIGGLAISQARQLLTRIQSSPVSG